MKRSIAIAAAGLAVIAGAVGAPAAAQAATPYKAICISSTGVSKDWHGKRPQSCKGEYRLYRIYSNSVGLMVDVLPKNRVGFYKAATESEKQLNDWCSSHSFTCAASVGAFFFILNPLLSAAEG